MLKKDVVSGFGGRIGLSARKPDGTVWTNLDTNAPYVFSREITAYNSATFGAWSTQADSDEDFYFQVRPDVDHVYIMFLAGTNGLKLKKFEIISVEGGTPVVTSGVPGTANQRISTQSPTTGWWSRGEVCENYNNAAAQAVGWKCGIAGWSAQTAWASATAYAVDDIVYNGANAYICTVAGTSAGSGGPTGTTPKTDETDNTVTWHYIGPRATFRPGPAMP